MLPVQSNLMFLLKKVFGTNSPRPGDLSEIEISQWQARSTQIDEWWSWFSGKALEVRDERKPKNKDGLYPLKYPLQWNPFIQAGRLHAYTLLGEIADTSGPAVRTVFVSKQKKAKSPATADGKTEVTKSNTPGLDKPDAEKKPIEAKARPEVGEKPKDTSVPPAGEEQKPLPALKPGEAPPPPQPPASEPVDPLVEEAEEVILKVYEQNQFRAQMMESGLSAQALGGVVFKIGYELPSPELPLGIRIETHDPRQFHCRWRGKNYWNLTEAWLSFTISREQALLTYSVEVVAPTAVMVEYWNETDYWIKVDDQYAVDEQGEINRPHNFGFVPFVYIPHERRNEFWGVSIVDGVVGMVKEWNGRIADIGDYVHFGIDSIVYGSNIRPGHPRRLTLDLGQTIYDLGRSTGNEPPGSLTRLEAPALPQGSIDLSNQLLENIRIALNTPDIAYGKEEGSQRSGETLYARLLPLLQHILSERTLWTIGLNLMAEMILRILASKSLGGITEAHLGQEKKQLWASMVPPDRQQVIDEVIRRRQEGAISIELMVQKFGDAEDPDTEIARIRESEQQKVVQKQQEMQMRVSAQAAKAEADPNDPGNAAMKPKKEPVNGKPAS